jgi:hypothetical protein
METYKGILEPRLLTVGGSSCLAGGSGVTGTDAEGASFDPTLSLRPCAPASVVTGPEPCGNPRGAGGSLALP